MIGSIRETIPLQLHKLQLAGVIDYEKSKFVVHVGNRLL
jgi:hypothetical protein